MKYELQKSKPNFRERMIYSGSSSLFDFELLAIILGTGVKKNNHSIDVSTLSKMLIKQFGLRGILTAFSSPQEIMQKTGLPKAKACLLASISEIYRRLHDIDPRKIASIKDACSFFAPLRKLQKESVQIACLTPENIVFHQETVAIGDSQKSSCPFINIFHPPIRFFSQRLIIAHNHPRCSAKPSPEDHTWHKKLTSLSRDLAIDLIDHIFVGHDDFYSFTSRKVC